MKNKGFTLVELLAVIVILAIIMIIAIPAVLNTMNNARRKSFIEFANKAILKAQEKYTLRNLEGLPVSGVIVYDIENDLGLSNTGDFKGYVIVDATESSNKGTYVYLYDKMFILDLKKSNDINVNNLENINGVEPVNNIEVLVDKAGYNSYYTANSSISNSVTNAKYEFLNSVEIDGHKYINTDVIPNDNIKVELLAEITKFGGIFGSRTGYLASDAYSLFGYFYYNQLNYFVYWADKGENKTINTSIPEGPIKINFENQTYKVNDTVITTLNSTTSINAKYPIYLFTVNNSNTPDSRIITGTFYSCKIYDGDNLIRNFVPAKKRDTGEEIIFDKIEKKEYPFISL